MFIFLVHPFDVGDTLLLCTTGGDAARHDVRLLRCIGAAAAVYRACVVLRGLLVAWWGMHACSGMFRGPQEQTGCLHPTHHSQVGGIHLKHHGT